MVTKKCHLNVIGQFLIIFKDPRHLIQADLDHAISLGKESTKYALRVKMLLYGIYESFQNLQLDYKKIPLAKVTNKEKNCLNPL